MGPIAGQDAYDPNAEADEAARLARARKRYEAASELSRRDDEEAQSDLLMRAGGINQWDPKAAQERQQLGRPLYTANRFPSMEAQIIGEIQANPPSIHCAPADSDATQQASEVFEGIIRSIQRLSLSTQVYSSAGAGAARCGRGHMRIVPVYADDESFDVELRIREIRDVLSVKWDPMAQAFDKADANWCIVVTELDREAFKEAYPDAGEAGWMAARASQRQLDGWHTGANNKVTVAEEWEVKREPYTRYRLAHTQPSYGGMGGVEIIPPTGEEVILDGDVNAETIDGEDAQAFLAEYAQAGFEVVQTRVAYQKKICMYLWGGSKQLAGPIEWKGQRIPIFTVPGRQVFVDGQTIHEGIIRHARDAQRLHNWARSTDLEAVSQSTKSSPMVPDDAIEGYEDEWAMAQKRPVPFRRYKWQPNMPPPRDGEPINSNPGPNALAQAAVTDMEDATGIHAASLGKKSNETSGVAIAERDAQTDTGTFVFIFNLRLIVESIGRELVAAIPHYYSTQKQIMILGQDDAPAIIELASVKLDLGKYHVIAKTGPAYANKREKAAEQLIELLKVAEPWMRGVLIMRALPMLDIPDAEGINEELRAMGMLAGALPPPPQAMGGAPGMPPPGMPGQLPPNVIPMPPRGAPPPGPQPPQTNMPFPPPSAPAARTRAGPAMSGPPGM